VFILNVLSWLYAYKGSTHSAISPIVKDNGGDISDSTNYPSTALVTIFSKILEHVISRVGKYLVDTHNQFGFNKRHCILMPVHILKDIMNFYVSHGSNMHLAFIDVSKVFDKVQYDISLFIKLSKFISGATLTHCLACWPNC
jgi:hypothetical protein